MQASSRLIRTQRPALTSKQLGTILVSAMIAFRLLAAPLLLYTYWNHLTGWALCLYGFAVLTDALDGQVARWLGCNTPLLGPYSDALADFVLVLSVFTAFVLRGLYPVWLLILFGVMFAQFVITSRLSRPVYDPIGKYYGVFLFAAAGMTFILPRRAVLDAILAAIVGFSTISLGSRLVFLLGSTRNTTSVT